jgi:hypothetical protein
MSQKAKKRTNKLTKTKKKKEEDQKIIYSVNILLVKYSFKFNL